MRKTVIKIGFDEFPGRAPQANHIDTAILDALKELLIGEAIKFRCTWNHSTAKSGQDICHGRGMVYQYSRGTPGRTQGTCREANGERWIYVRRVPDIGQR
jgi:hypothetical protein